MAGPYNCYIGCAGGAVTVVDTSTDSLIATIGTGGFGTEVSPDNTVVASGSDTGTVGLISTSSLTLLHNVNTTGSSFWPAFTPDSLNVYSASANGSSTEVDVVNVASHSQTTTISTPPSTNFSFVCINPAGTTAYALNQDTVIGGVQVIDIASATPTTFISMGNVAQMVISADGSTGYVTNYNATGHTITKVNLATNTIVGTLSTGSGLPFGICLSPDGSTGYVVVHGPDFIAQFDTASFSITNTLTLSLSGNNGSGIAITPDGLKLYVGYQFGTTIEVLTTGPLALYTTVNVGVRGPNYPAIAPPVAAPATAQIVMVV